MFLNSCYSSNWKTSSLNPCPNCILGHHSWVLLLACLQTYHGLVARCCAAHSGHLLLCTFPQWGFWFCTSTSPTHPGSCVPSQSTKSRRMTGVFVITMKIRQAHTVLGLYIRTCRGSIAFNLLSFCCCFASVTVTFQGHRRIAAWCSVTPPPHETLGLFFFFLFGSVAENFKGSLIFLCSSFWPFLLKNSVNFFFTINKTVSKTPFSQTKNCQKQYFSCLQVLCSEFSL